MHIDSTSGSCTLPHTYPFTYTNTHTRVGMPNDQAPTAANETPITSACAESYSYAHISTQSAPTPTAVLCEFDVFAHTQTSACGDAEQPVYQHATALT